MGRQDEATTRTDLAEMKKAAGPSTGVMLGTLGPRSERIVIRRRPGKAIQASTPRCAQRSTRPLK